MKPQDPFDRVRKANPVQPDDLPGPPLGTAARIMARKARSRLSVSGPVLALVSMATVLLVGAVTAAVLIGGSGQTVVTQDSTIPVSGPTQPAPKSTTSTTVAEADSSVTTTTIIGVAPWSQAPLPQSAVPVHLIEDWGTAENQTWCSALYPAGGGALVAGAVSRPAEFGGGWAVAWDLPDGPGRSADGGYCPDCGRGAFGVAGAGLTGTVDDLSIWPNQIAWEDGSRAGYGLEGLEEPGSGAPLLSYVVVEGQGCLYDVWSFLGEDHLLALLNSLRYVEGMRAEPIQLVDRANQETREMGAAPWNESGLAGAAVPQVFFDEWTEDLQTTACRMLAFSDLGPEGEGAVARRANGDGALIVAWDLPSGPGRYGTGEPCADCGRGAFGTSLEQLAGLNDYRTEGNPTLRYDDGSEVWIFPELNYNLPDDRIVHLDPETGEFAPEAYRAFIAIDGEPVCVYQVWSSYGPDHVEYLVSQLRYVEG